MAQFVRPVRVTKENKCLKCQIVGEGGLRGDGEGGAELGEIGPNLKQFPVILMFHDSTFDWRKIKF